MKTLMQDQLKHQRYIAFMDLEANIFRGYQEIIEIAIIVTDINFNLVDSYSSLCKPQRYMNPKISFKVKIYDDELDTAPYTDEIIPEIDSIMTKYNINKVFVYGDADGDYCRGTAVLYDQYSNEVMMNLADKVVNIKNILIHDLQLLTNNNFPYQRKIGLGLSDLANFFDLPLEGHHRAYNDALVLKEIATQTYQNTQYPLVLNREKYMEKCGEVSAKLYKNAHPEEFAQDTGREPTKNYNKQVTRQNNNQPIQNNNIKEDIDNTNLEF